MHKNDWECINDCHETRNERPHEYNGDDTTLWGFFFNFRKKSNCRAGSSQKLSKTPQSNCGSRKKLHTCQYDMTTLRLRETWLFHLPSINPLWPPRCGLEPREPGSLSQHPGAPGWETTTGNGKETLLPWRCQIVCQNISQRKCQIEFKQGISKCIQKISKRHQKDSKRFKKTTKHIQKTSKTHPKDTQKTSKRHPKHIQNTSKTPGSTISWAMFEIL